MLTEILLWICIILLLLFSYKYAVSRPKGFPPGPPRIPLFGSYLFMMLSDFKYMHKAVLKLSKWYKTDILGFHMGPYLVIAAHNQQAVREILLNQDFDGRPQLYLGAMRDPDLKVKGIIFKDGPIWKEQRRFILRQLRDFGFGRRFTKLEQVIQEEINGLLDLIRNGSRYEHEKAIVKSEGYRILLPHAFNIPSANSMLYVAHGMRYPRSEQAVIHELSKHIMTFQRVSDDYGKMLSIMPWIRHIFPKWSSYDQLMECNRFIHKFFSNIIDQHLGTYDEGYERNFIDKYIKKWKAAEKDMKDDSHISFSRNQFVLALTDFHFPAVSAVGIQISFLIQHLLLQPNVLKRIQREIDEVVGFGRLPTLDDRKYLHFTEAAIREALRIETLVPSDVPHLAMVDTELLGYKVPKNTIVIPSLYAFHNDKRAWVDPENFRPDRFLDERGHLSLKLDISLPFGAGKRLCAGETFARNILFLLTASLCQNFNFVLGPNDKLPDLSNTLSGLTTSPPDFWLQLEERK